MKNSTDIEQSKKLIELGIDINTADMMWDDWSLIDEGWKLSIGYYPEIEKDYGRKCYPAWSLAALLGLMPKGEGKDLSLVFGSYDGGYHPLWFCTYEEVPMILEICAADNPIDACVEMIYKLKEIDLL